MITASGFDSVWFGIYLVLMIELAQITPPGWIQSVCDQFVEH